MKKKNYEKRDNTDCINYNDNSIINISRSNNISFSAEKMEY